jgi:heat shock protein HslJ
VRRTRVLYNWRVFPVNLPQRTVAFSMLALLLAACIAPAPTPDDEPPPEGQWELVTSNFIESGRLPGVPRPTLDIAGGRLAAYSGCNRGNGSVRAVHGRLAVDGLHIVHRPCPEPVGSYDARYFGLLRDTPVYHVHGDTLRLVAGDYNAYFKKR